MLYATSKKTRGAVSRLLLAVLLVGAPALTFAATPDDAPVQFQSSNYGLQSTFFGNTGTVYSYTATVPPVITSTPVVSSIAQTSVTISWQTDKVSNSVVFLGTTAGTYTNQYGQLTDTLVTAHTVPVERLTRGTTYYYKVRSVDVDGNTVESSAASFSTDPGDIVSPVITTGPSLSIDSASLVTVSWQTNELASSTVEYGIKSATENSIGPSDDLTLFHQVKISGLTPSQAYIWHVKTKDASGNITYSPTQNLATPNSPFISGFAVTDVTLSSAVVQWTTSTASSTVLQYGSKSSVYDQKYSEATFSTNHIVRLTNLPSGTTFYMRVSGVDQAGNVLQSDEKIFATVVIPQITDFKVTNITADSAVLTWHSSSQVDELLRYEIKDHPDKTFIGKKFSGGSDKLVSDHSYTLTDLESAATYAITVLGKDIFGNQALSPSLSFVTLPDSTPPELLNIRSDTTIDLGSKQTVQVLVSAECTELCRVSIEYGPGASGPYDKKVETDLNFSRAKFLVIPELQPGQSYHYRIVARDRTGNAGNSADYLILAPAQPVSLLDLIFGQIRSNFGWLGNL